MTNIKTVTHEQIVNILKRFCINKGWEYVGCVYESKCNWVVFSYIIPVKLYLSIRKERYGYCMSLDEDYTFKSVMRGLTKQLKGYTIIDIENFKV